MSLVLGIETSCDETAASIVSSDKFIHSNVIWSQIAEHQPYGGVVPEIAARSHLDMVDHVIKQALIDANKTLYDLDAIAVTSGPGLIGGLIVGLMSAKALAFALDKPLIAVNHLEGHALTARLTSDLEFPFLLLLVSGGHTEILIATGVGEYIKLGGTIDDAIGEAFDKVAKMLGLNYPGGPEIEKIARNGDRNKYKFPRALIDKSTYDFSFSGMKTAVKRTVDQSIIDDASDIAASFEQAVTDIVINRMNNAIKFFKANYNGSKIIIAGGVASNLFLQTNLAKLAKHHEFELIAPPLNLCTDNAAMIAWAGIERLNLGLTDSLEVAPRARWKLYS